ncbi:MAG: 1-deoxy-D-xylulose-5-phosphate synthase, partial [Clostridia bacterium]|nr:1-deoxy-D-xylulose-5-phosphate synthase [Clostridia bacterium]
MLENITRAKLKKMTLKELIALCEEAREVITQTVLKNGGHLSSNLGMVELTVALHYVFDFPEDKLVFDVGHQCYTHKLLTGRYDKFNTIRQKNGISGFPKREESPYDCYDTGHAGTSVSAALGIAKARDIKGENFNVIAVIGDGSFNNGLIYEAFNSLRLLNTNVLLILNDNGMSIAPTVGSMHEYLEILSEDITHKSKVDRHAKIFERFGFGYDGVYDGNDLEVMINKLTEVKERIKTESVILHIITKKGKGYAFCEDDPEATHGISKGNPSSVSTEYSQVLGNTLTRLAEKNNKIVAVTAAMTSSLGLSEFFEKYPNRSVDVGICEEHATILCASMASAGLKPYYAVYSTFLQRSFDEIVLDICEQNLPVTLCVDRAGISGADGETHQGVFDLSFLSLIPNLTIAVPKDLNEFEKMIEFSEGFNAPLAIRYPRDGKKIFGACQKIEKSKWERLIKGDGKYAILACGERAITQAFVAAEQLKKDGIEITVVNARFVKPLDTEMLDGLKEKIILTVEDNMLTGGFGSLVNGYFSGKEKVIKNFAYADEFIPQGSVAELMSERGVNGKDIA